MPLTKKNLYVHMPIHRLLKQLYEFLAFNLSCEIYVSSEFIDSYSLKDLELIRQSFKKRCLSIRVHGPFIDLNPGSSDKRIREVSLERFLKALEISDILNSKSITFHSHFEPIFYKRHFEQWLKNSDEVWGPLNSKADKNGTAIYIENSIENDLKAILAILARYPLFGICFDVAHHNVFNPHGWKDALEKCPAGAIKEIHLSDNNGDEDSHLPLGEGSIDFKDFFLKLSERDEDAIFTLEPHSQDGLIKNLGFIKKFMGD